MDRTLIETTFKSVERRLWGLCSHMTGVAADADELVQETFVRAMESGRVLTGVDFERWLVRVATISVSRRPIECDEDRDSGYLLRSDHKEFRHSGTLADLGTRARDRRVGAYDGAFVVREFPPAYWAVLTTKNVR